MRISGLVTNPLASKWPAYIVPETVVPVRMVMTIASTMIATVVSTVKTSDIHRFWDFHELGNYGEHLLVSIGIFFRLV
jgi:hypothetical protein